MCEHDTVTDRAGYQLHGEPSTVQPSSSSDARGYLPVAERERLLKTPFSVSRNEHGSAGYSKLSTVPVASVTR